MTTIDSMFPVAMGDKFRVFFKNGYGASFVRRKSMYGGRDGLYQLAVLKGTEDDYELCYTTHLTKDVIRDVSSYEIDSYLKQIESL